jgi:LacI family transcriptional regulator
MTKQIGIITNNQTSVFQRDVIAGVEQALQQHDYTVLVDAIEEHSENGLITTLRISDMDGLLVIANALNDADLQTLYDTGKPITLVSHWVNQLPISAIVQNNIEGIKHLVDYLIEDCGRREIVFIMGDMNQHDGIERERIFQQSMMRHDLLVPPSHMLHGDFEAQIAAESLTDFIKQSPSFDAVVAADFLMGVAALNVLAEESIHVPDDVCVVGFGDGPEAEAAGLTTVGADIIEMGRRAARQLLVQMDGKRFSGVTWLNTELIERSSCQRIIAKA